MIFSKSYTPWVLLSLALIAWGGVALFALTIQSDEADRTLRIQAIQEAKLKEASALRLRSIARDTLEERARLEKLVQTDVVGIVDMMERAGSAAGVKVTVSNVVTEGISSDSRGEIGITNFIVESQGRFAALMHLLSLLETLPLPSAVTTLDLEYVPLPGEESRGTWHLNARLRVVMAQNHAL